MLPEKTIERLSLYRRILKMQINNGKEYIYSHELASIMHITPVQVRRDIMLIGHSGSQSKGYISQNLIDKINYILDYKLQTNAIIIGMGHLGRAITNYFGLKKNNIEIIAGFDNNSQKVDQIIAGIRTYHIDSLEIILEECNASIAIMALSPRDAQAVTDTLVDLGIKGILNFTSEPLNVPSQVCLENYDIITSMEKLAYFVKEKIEND